MRTRSQSRNNFPQQEASPAIVEPLRIDLPFLEDQFQEDLPEDPPEVPMANNQTMAELLQAPPRVTRTQSLFLKLQQTILSLSTKMPRECLKIIDSKSKVHQSRAKPVVAKVSTSSSTPTISSEVAELKDLVRALLLDKKNQSSAPAQSSTSAPVKAGQNLQIQMANLTDMLSKFVSSNTASSSGSGTLPSNTITNPKEDLKGITTRSGVAYQGPTISTMSKVVKQGTEVTKDQVQTSSSQGMDECLALADLGASINLMPLSVWEGLSLSELTLTCMTLKLENRSVSKPIGIVKDVSVQVGVFHFPADFVVVDFKPDPRVPLIIERYFLKTGRALIDVHKGELTLRIENEAITYNLDQTVRYSANYNQMTANKINIIYEVYSQKVLGFSNVTVSGNPTPYDDPIISTMSPTLTPFGDSDFLLFEEAGAFLGLEDDPNSPNINPFYYDREGDIILLEAILNSKPLPPLPNHKQYMHSFKKELKVCEAKTIKSSVNEPPEVELKDLPPHLEYAFLEGDKKFPVIIAKELGDEEKSALIKTLKKKLTEAPILIAPNWDLPFELMCDASDFAICAVLGQRHEKHFKPIHYASKTMTDAESNYTMTEKEMLAVVYAFEKFRSYLIMNKSIVHMDHSALKYLFAKKDAKARLLRAPWFADFANYHAGNFIVKDYLSKWVEAKALPTNDARVVCKFLISLFARFGSPRAIISDHGENRASWSDKLDDALWAFCITYKTPIGCTPYKLVYGKACHLSIELEHKAYWALKQVNFDLAVAGGYRKVQLNELNELRDLSYENSLIYKEKIKIIHDSKIKNRVFNVGDRVLLFNSRLKIFPGKLKTHWSGPFTITKVFPYGTVELSQTNGPNFKVNGHRVKHYFGGDVPQLVVPDLQTIPVDQ
nr:reverse transcriptase domain-containing protein [Tanacetum cinerariifolium]